MGVRILTIGFTKKDAQGFFEALCKSGAKRLVDVRLNNVSQLAGFAKRQDLPYLLGKLCGMEYLHLPILAPTAEMLQEYKKNRGSWEAYEAKFLELMEARRIQEVVPREVLSDGCLLCSEDKPDYCHRRLVAEYLQRYWNDVEIEHLL